MDILRDPIWEGIAALVTIAGALLATIAFLVPAFRERLRLGLHQLTKSTIIRRIIAILVILIVGMAIGFLIAPRTNTNLASYPLFTQVASVAWNALGSNDYELAITLAQVCVATYEDQAVQLQNGLVASSESLPPTDRVSDAERNEIFSQGVLNEVAACYYIKGQALEALRCVDEAREAYQNSQRFPYARVWDPNQELFWSPAEAATQILARLPTNTVEKTCLPE